MIIDKKKIKLKFKLGGIIENFMFDNSYVNGSE